MPTRTIRIDNQVYERICMIALCVNAATPGEALFAIMMMPPTRQKRLLGALNEVPQLLSPEKRVKNVL